MTMKIPLIGLSSGNKPEPDGPNEHFKLDRDGVLRLYAEAVALAGGLPLNLPLVRAPLGPAEEEDENLGPAGCGPGALHHNAKIYMERLDGLILTGGGDIGPGPQSANPSEFYRGVDRARDAWEAALLAAALESDKSVLGICRGIQVINVALGGSLWADLPSERPDGLDHNPNKPRALPSHPVALKPGGRLAGLAGAGEIQVNSLHHQAVREPAPLLEAVGHSPDGVIEAVEHRRARFVIGVQWHPEPMTPQAAHARNLFSAFVQAAGAR